MNFIIKRLLNCMRRSICVGLLLLSSLTVFSQRVALKTNALYWAAASPNLGLELRVNSHITFDLDATFHRLKWKDKLDTRAEILTPEVRYWFSARPQARITSASWGLPPTTIFVLTTNVTSATPLVRV